MAELGRDVADERHGVLVHGEGRLLRHGHGVARQNEEQHRLQVLHRLQRPVALFRCPRRKEQTYKKKTNKLGNHSVHAKRNPWVYEAVDFRENSVKNQKKKQ